MSRRNFKHPTVSDLLNQGKSEKFEVSQGKKGNIRILRKGQDIREKQPTEIYINESELKKAAVDNVLIYLKRCRILKTDNMPLLVGRGKRIKSREPGMSDQHLCIRGKFVALEAKMPGKTLDPDQVDYKRDVEAALGIHIEYHSIWELETELMKNKLISRRMFK
jgi:hypothetical protein